jgi:hypothetical protein
VAHAARADGRSDFVAVKPGAGRQLHAGLAALYGQA